MFNTVDEYTIIINAQVQYIQNYGILKLWYMFNVQLLNILQLQFCSQLFNIAWTWTVINFQVYKIDYNNNNQYNQYCSIHVWKYIHMQWPIILQAKKSMKIKVLI